MERSPRQIAGLVMMGSGLLLTTSALVVLVLARPVYKATARIVVQPEPSSSPTPSNTNAPAFDPYWIESEFERIHAKVILYPVITNLNLQLKWAEEHGARGPLSMQEAYRLLLNRMAVRQTMRTSLIEISIACEDPAEAAKIANIVAQVYCDWRAARRPVRSSISPLLIVDRIPEIIDVAEQSFHPARGKHSLGVLPVVLLGVGILNVLGGYFVVRPTLGARDHGTLTGQIDRS
jgi:uncharacterized protein involved in exopolysaccharide biosynthesis